MELTPIAAKVLALMLDGLSSYLFEINHLIQKDATSLFVVFTALYLVFCCWMGFHGKFTKENLKDVGISFLILAFVGQSIVKSDFYIEHIVLDYIESLIDTASWFASKGSVNNFYDIFKHLDSGFALIATNLIDKVPDGSFAMNTAQYFNAWFAMGIFGLSYGLMYIAFLALIILALFIIHILFVLGLFCIFLGSFKETRFVFWAWFRAIANYSLIIIFAAIVMSVGFKGIESSLALYSNVLLTQGVFNGEFAALVVWSLVCFAVLLKVPDLASALSGGTAGSTTGIVAGMSMAGGAAIAGLHTAGKNAPTALRGAYAVPRTAVGAAVGTVSKWTRRAGE